MKHFRFSLPSLGWIPLCVLCPGALLADDPPPAPAAGKAEHVLIMVCDGLRPDSVTEQDMPTLSGSPARA